MERPTTTEIASYLRQLLREARDRARREAAGAGPEDEYQDWDALADVLHACAVLLTPASQPPVTSPPAAIAAPDALS